MDNKIPKQSKLTMLLAQTFISLEQFSFHSGLPLDALLNNTEEVRKESSGIYDILEKVYPWFHTFQQCWNWYISQSIESFDNKTPAEVVKIHGIDGIKALIAFIDQKNLGAYE